jgi:photosystem II stability/assembly factor-like uncharacterized protein
MGDNDRSKWFTNLTSYLDREPDALKLARYRREIPPGDFAWKCVGPMNFGGRVTSLVVDPGDPLHVFAGAAAGGVWETSDGGNTWETIWSKQETLNIGSLAIAPQDPGIVYCGTGEANVSGDSYPGIGLYRYSKLDQPPLRCFTSQYGTRVGALAVDPFDSSRLALGSISFSDEEFAGCSILTFSSDFRPQDVTQPERPFVPTFRCHSILFSPSVQNRIYMSIDARGAENGIWRSDDGGKLWRHLLRGLPPPEMFGRTSLAISPSNPSTMYALAGDRKHRFLGVFRSDNEGESWRVISGSHFVKERSLGYCNCIAVDPADPEFVICGAVDLHRSRNGGADWEQITEWDLPEADPHYAHSDHHALAIPHPGMIYDCNDGGVDVSENGGDTWNNRSKGLAIAMFYDFDAAASERDVFGGGVQDNGTLFHGAGQKAGEFIKVLPGDGGWMIIDPLDPNHIYGSSQNMDVYRLQGGSWSNVTPFQATKEERDATWMAFLAMDQSDGRSDPRPVFAGSTRVWKTVDDGEHWEAVSEELDGSAITALEVCSLNPWFVYAGTNKGGVFRSIDRGNNWSGNLAGIYIPRQTISRIACHPIKKDFVMLTVPVCPPTPWTGGIDEHGNTIPGTYAHVYQSVNAGLTWEDADPFRQLPDVPYTSLCFERKPPHRVFIAGALGVFQGAWDTKESLYRWTILTGELPNVMVTDIVYHELTQCLFAATYGRGVWRLELNPKPPKPSRKDGSLVRGSRVADTFTPDRRRSPRAGR